MFVEYRCQSIFTVKSEALVNPVNCVGIMGKGLALEFKERFPLNFKQYKTECQQKKLVLGRSLSICKSEPEALIINFPTKNHWREPSHIEYIEMGLELLSKTIIDLDIRVISMPRLGCGLGGLDWTRVRPLIYQKLEKCNVLTTIQIFC